MSLPSSVIFPATISDEAAGSSRMMESDVTDFPEPDSPTIPEGPSRVDRDRSVRRPL